jgi:fructose-bisphosphate aldolase class I
MPDSHLPEIAKKLVASGKGILAADESFPTIEKRFSEIGVESNEDNRRFYRQLLFTTDKVEEFISGVIMFDESIRQKTDEGKLFTEVLNDKGIIPGIKVDMGAKDMANFPGEKITEGLDGLRERLVEYKNLGAKFTKWRAVITIGEEPFGKAGIPTDTCINSNSEALARFAALSQEAGLVPIVEPEVIRDGVHDIKRGEEVTYKTLKSVFSTLDRHKVMLDGMLLKPNMVTPGKDYSEAASPQDVAAVTIKCVNEMVPQEVPGLVFLSGGQTPQEATTNLNEMNKQIKSLPAGRQAWEISFSYGRALQNPVLKAWGGKAENISTAQKEFYKRAKLNGLARNGLYTTDLEDI